MSIHTCTQISVSILKTFKRETTKQMREREREREEKFYSEIFNIMCSLFVCCFEEKE